MPELFVHELRVRYGECDPQGIVFNANYLLYFDVAFTEFWREAVGPWQEMVAKGVDAVVANAGLRFRAPARYDDVVSCEMRIVGLGETSVSTEMRIMRDGTLLVVAVLEHVCVDAQTWKRTAFPDFVRDGLTQYVVADEAEAEAGQSSVTRGA
jgi:acyl-CoA thioester hydrolase